MKRGAGARGLASAALVAACWCARAAAPLEVAAQDNPAIRIAVALAAEGRGDSARRIIASELARARSGEPAYIEALYWRGRLATSGDSAERDLRRVAIEFSTSRWADDALLQLAQLALTAGNPASARDLATRLRSDYPSSDLRPRAAYWAARAAFEAADVAGGCSLLDSARAEAPDDVEFQNQIAFYRGRCAVLQAAAPGAPPTPPGDTQAARGAGFEVQVAATRSDRTAEAVVRRLARAGIEAHVASGPDGYRRVRTGPFASLREAEAAIRAARRAVGGEPFVVPKT